MRLLFLSLFLLPNIVFADGTLYVAPATGSYQVGQVFNVKVLADSGGDPINAAEAELDFDPTGLAVLSLSTDGSIMSSWPTVPTYSNEDGTIQFSGWAEKKYTGPNGLLITITFKALRMYTANARLAAGAILAADGRESNIITSMKSGAFTIEAPPPLISQTQDSFPTTATTSDVAMQEIGPVQPDAPMLLEYPRTVNVGESIVLKGSADPNTPVTVYSERGDEATDSSHLMTAADGTFTFATDPQTLPGIYSIWAIEERGSMSSEPTRKIIIEVTSPGGLSETAQTAGALAEEVFPYLAVLVLAGLGAAYLMHKHAIERSRLNHLSDTLTHF